MAFRLDHVSLLVRDIDTATRFYVDVFGWPIVRTSGDPVSGRWLGIGGSDTLHLSQGDMGDTHVTKYNHLAIRVDGFDDFLARLSAVGVPYCDWSGRPGTVGRHAAGFRQVYVRDPDGYWIEINDNTRGE